MSGLEVLGAITGVLGILPVAVDALKTHKGILSSIQNAARDLASLIRDLETEKVRLQTTCERLLEGVAPLAMIDGMTKDLFGAVWEKYSHSLRLRFWESEQEFINLTLDMRDDAMELRDKLCIYGDSSSKLADKLSILRELKKRVSFTLNKNDYIDIVSRIKRGNSALYELASKSRGLESDRRKRSQARLIKLVRGVSTEVFQAIQKSTICGCIASHRVCLELVARDAILTLNDLDDDVARSFKFHVAFGSDNNVETNSTNFQCISVNGQSKPRWSNIYFQLGTFESTGMSVITPSLATAYPKSTKNSWLRGLSLLRRKDRPPSKIVSAVQAAGVQAAIPSMAISSRPGSVSNLCHMFTSHGKRPAMDSLSYIASIDRNFGIYPPDLHMDCCAVLTLREILEGNPQKVAQLSPLERLRIARAIAVNTLHLYNIPWVDECLTLDTVNFFLPNDGEDLDTTLLDRPFVVKSFSAPPSKQDILLSIPRPINRAVFSVGALLIQLMIGRTESALEMAGPMDARTIISKRNAGKRLFDQLLENGGINLKPAIEWCFDSVCQAAGLQNDEYCQQFFQEVVSRLEDDIKLLS
ncbi:hypothetical protein J3F84DRAFT_407510 [Trichoderma pleuroticola]